MIETINSLNTRALYQSNKFSAKQIHIDVARESFVTYKKSPVDTESFIIMW